MRPVSAFALSFSVLLCAACSSSGRDDASSSSEQRAIGDTVSITRCPSSSTNTACPSGSFSVVCTDGSHEIDTEAQVLANQLCKPKPPPPCCDPSSGDCDGPDGDGDEDDTCVPPPPPPATAPTPAQCLEGWSTLNGQCAAPTITSSYVANGCVGTTGWFVEGNNFELERHNVGIADDGPQSFGANGNQKHWNVITPTKLCVTVSATFKSVWVGQTIYVKNPDGKASNSVVVEDRL
jgi:hypothetical protein